MKELVLAGNPNAGKTTLFNELTGARQSVGNWPGVTVEKKQGKFTYQDEHWVVTDLPGTYSLSPYSMEEKIAGDYIVEQNPAVVINIIDASNLERNLYLTLQLLELQQPTVIAMNMMDIVERWQIELNIKKLSEKLGIPIVPISASQAEGLEELRQAVSEVSKDPSIGMGNPLTFSKEIEELIQELMKEYKLEDGGHRARWQAIRIIEEDLDVCDALGVEIEHLYDHQRTEITHLRYRYIHDLIDRVMKRPDRFESMTEKADKVLMHPWFGLPIFGFFMFLVFKLTFSLGGLFAGPVEGFFGWLSMNVGLILTNLHVAEWMISLITDGVIAGVGGVLVFLPNIAFLFLALAILEDSGYMARVAFIMDRFMRKVGLSGKAFIPLLMGFGCSVPAVMATRSLESDRDRKASMMMIPFMSCGARMPIYMLFSSIFFPGREAIVTFFLYFLGILVAVLMGTIFKDTLFKGSGDPFIMEMPSYHTPTIKTVGRSVKEEVGNYIVKAGTVILAASVVLWGLLNFNMHGMVEMVDSFGAQIGHWIAPIFAPMGFGNWQSSLSLITGIVAKETIVANISIIFGMGEAAGQAALNGDTSSMLTGIQAAFPLAAAFAFLIFSLLYTPCVATLAVIKRETKSWRWMFFSASYTFLVAWIYAVIGYTLASRFSVGVSALLLAVGTMGLIVMRTRQKIRKDELEWEQS
jgi:ferrous iron transport protein B